MGFFLVAVLLWGVFWLVTRFRAFLFSRLPSPKHALVFAFFGVLAIFVLLLTWIAYDEAIARSNLPVVRSLAEVRQLPARTEIALVGRVSPSLPLAYYDEFVVYTTDGAYGLMNGASDLTLELSDGQIQFANRSYQIDAWRLSGMDTFGLMRDDPVVVYARVTRAGEDYIAMGPQPPGEHIVALLVMLGTHDGYVRAQRRGVVLFPYIAVALAANSLAWFGLSVLGYFVRARKAKGQEKRGEDDVAAKK